MNDRESLVLLFSKFSGRIQVPEERIQRFCSAFSLPILAQKREEIIRKDDASRHLHFILRGTIAEIGEDEKNSLTVPNVYGPGDFVFNLQRHTTRLPSKTAYRCMTPVLMMKMEGNDLKELLEEPGFDEVFFVLQQHLLAQVRAHFLNLLHLSPLKHYEWLLMEKPWLVNTLTRNQLAAFLGVSRATFFRLLAQHESNR